MNAQERVAMMLGQKDIQIASMGDAMEQANEKIKALQDELDALKPKEEPKEDAKPGEGVG